MANVHLPAAARGPAAINALGAHLPAVARAYGLDAQELATMFRVQPSLGVDTGGALLFTCEAPRVSPSVVNGGRNTPTTGNALTATSSTMQLVSGAAVDAFQLHSLPGAGRVVYLDFDGHVTSGTAWNSSFTGGANIVSQPFDLDGDPTTFSATERAMIQGIWKRVAEDYAPFAIDVTTQDPGVEGLRKLSSSDTAYGMRVVVSQTNWYNQSYGGVGYVGSFSWNSDTPCFVFAAQLANGEKYIAECCSHETGHTVGLTHDGLGGSSPTEYYQGQGDWGPIMGNSYYRSVTQFSQGEYANANNTQDDLAVIATYAPVMADDHGNTLAAATVLTGPAVAGGGTIETRVDVDVLRFDTGAGAISVNVASPAGDADLSARVELLNSAGQVLLVNDSAAVAAAFNTTVPAGTYFVRVSGIGFGDPLTTGYSDYASLGNYVITGTLVGISGRQAPVARLTTSTTSGTAALSVSFSGQNSTDADGTLVGYAWDFGNGTGSTAMNPSCTYTAAGTYIAVLTVTDNDGLTNSASVTITVTASANVAPTALASASTTSGTAPLLINFSSAGSFDPDGSITSYLWTFGDGTSSTVASPSKTYSVAGSYTAVLKVTDNLGATSSASIAIAVTGDSATKVDVAGFSLTKSTTNAGTTAVAAVVVKDNLGRPVAGVTVNLQWSGLVGTKANGRTDAYGQVLLSSGRTKKTGTITGTITSVTPPAGVTYDSSIYSAPTQVSIAAN